MNKKLIKTIASITCGLGIVESIPFMVTSCGSSDNQKLIFSHFNSLDELFSVDMSKMNYFGLDKEKDYASIINDTSESRLKYAFEITNDLSQNLNNFKNAMSYFLFSDILSTCLSYTRIDQDIYYQYGPSEWQTYLNDKFHSFEYDLKEFSLRDYGKISEPGESELTCHFFGIKFNCELKGLVKSEDGEYHYLDIFYSSCGKSVIVAIEGLFLQTNADYQYTVPYFEAEDLEHDDSFNSIILKDGYRIAGSQSNHTYVIFPCFNQSLRETFDSLKLFKEDSY